MMSLGKISVADGQAPKDFQLYGIINSRSNTHRPHAIEYINLEKASDGRDSTTCRQSRLLLCSQTFPEAGALVEYGRRMIAVRPDFMIFL